MSLPLIIKDIEDRLKLSGGKIDGNLFLNGSVSKYSSGDQNYIHFLKGSVSQGYLGVNGENNPVFISADATTIYDLYGEHNKPTAVDVGAMPDIYINWRGYSDIESAIKAELINVVQTNKALAFSTATSGGNPFLVVATNDGGVISGLYTNYNGIYKGFRKDGTNNWYFYNFYGEHNKPTPAAIGAPTTTGSGASGTWGINISGNAATATNASKLATARNIALDGAITGGATFDGSNAITINTTAKEIYNEGVGAKWYHNSIGNSSENGSAWYKLYEVSHTSGYGTYEAYKVSGYIYRHNGNWHQVRTEKIPFIIIINISGDTCEIHSSVLYNSNELRVLKKGVRNYEVQYCPNGNHKMFDIYYQITGSGGAGTRYAHGTTATSASSGFITSCTQLTSYGNQAYNSQLVGGYSITHSNASVPSSLTDKKIYLQYT